MYQYGIPKGIMIFVAYKSCWPYTGMCIRTATISDVKDEYFCMYIIRLQQSTYLPFFTFRSGCGKWTFQQILRNVLIVQLLSGSLSSKAKSIKQISGFLFSWLLKLSSHSMQNLMYGWYVQYLFQFLQFVNLIDQVMYSVKLIY